MRARLNFWKSCLPDIRPHYAVKSNNLPCILEELYKGGAGFDCASSDEIRAVHSVGARHTDIIYANPCKSRNEIHTAKTFNIQYITFDNLFEFEKIVDEYNESKPILRIFVDDKGGSRIPLNKKFGMHIQQLRELTKKDRRFRIYGLAFHVGSDCTSVESYKSAFRTVSDFMYLLNYADNLITPEILDIGGGFSGNSKNDSFFQDHIAPLIRKEVKKLPFQKVIAEPGRFFAEESSTLHVSVIGKKKVPSGENCITIDDSVYGIFSGVLFDGFKPEFNCITRTPNVPMQQYTIFGRTCDSADKIAEGIWLPVELNDSDILEVKRIGAYSLVSSSEFNGFSKPTIQVLS